MKQRPLIILTGPTAVGKTALSIELAKRIHGQMISADSMQVYRHMDIGTAKIRPEEMEGIPHYLIDVLEPEEDFHVVRFQEMAKAALEQVYASGSIPILVGGTGFYIQALLYDIEFEQEEYGQKWNGTAPIEGIEAVKEDSYRQKLQELANEHGAEYLHEQLRQVDPASADAIHANNVKRVIRALEFYHQTGTCISAHNEEQRQKESPYNFLYFVLTDDRNRLYERIDKRIDSMIEQGLVEEVRRLKASGCTRNMVSMQGLGYKEILNYLEGNCTLEEAVYVLKRDTRHFAKRQLTWFRRERDVIWLDRREFPDEEALLYQMLDYIQDRILTNI
ncbi:MAG: tRNA (adenosine(37)-N6)-dimethylallyltransferase MiaA [Bacteroides sp.]|nr:tRNA (adenosine(37)-N6)-dimethylallyltransferase MiaA [Bacteroides sp.]MCM1549360.1 tRNA (adenosine(37)-N6)-dimethylallyltransferase MiaA [Clostridium sp.]